MKKSDTEKELLLTAPVSGPMIPIEKVPDPVFAQKMVGDGISIDPLSSELLAPCDGTIIHIHPALHAVTLEAAGGVELLLHVGVDTVGLKGEGFDVLVKENDHVKTGTPLLKFDIDLLARKAKSLLTQMVVSTPDRVTSFSPETGTVTAGKDTVLTLKLAGNKDETQEKSLSNNTVRSDAIVIPNPTGIHARPAAVLASIAKRFNSVIQIECSGKMANAKSITALLKLNIKQNDKVVLLADGPDAQNALQELEAAVSSGLGDMDGSPVSAPASKVTSVLTAPPPRPANDDPDLVLGVAASPGLAVGFVQQIKQQDIKIDTQAGTPKEEQAALDAAFETAALDLEALQARLHSENNSDQAAIFAAHSELLKDPELVDIAGSAIAKGQSAAAAWKQAFELQAKELEQMDNELLAQRANDLLDVGRRVLLILTGADNGAAEYKDQTILVAEDLSPSDTARLDRNKILGFCTVHGGSTSHAAILARAMGIPAVVGAEAAILKMKDGEPIILNGSTGEIRLNPPDKLVKDVKELRQKIEQQRSDDLKNALKPATTTDGVTIEVVANIGNAEEAAQINEAGGEGVGLLRSEFLFMNRSTAPTEEEQFTAYTDILKAMKKNAPLIIRTLDVGGDKPLRYLPLPAEENPFLGVRGVRVGLMYPELLRTQLRAILRASSEGNVKIMFPMISSINEWNEAKGMLDQEVKNIGCKPVPAGIMVEVPATAVLASQFAKKVDFFSIGTNDLTQYTLAMDRGHPQLASKIDGMNPAVLSLIGATADAAHKEKIMAGVCGGTASDIQAVPILIGLGVTELSVSIPVIPAVKSLIRKLSISDCKKLAAKAVEASSAKEVRKLTPTPLAAQIQLGSTTKRSNQ